MRVLMIASSYPKFPGDSTAPFIASLARGVAAEIGEPVDVLVPFHPDLAIEDHSPRDGVRLHVYRYAPFRRWNLWGYATSLTADREVKWPVYLLLPLALASSFSALVALTRATTFDILHVHWVIPNGPVGAWAAKLRRTPFVMSLHGSDVFLAEKMPPLGLAARYCFRRAAWTTAASDDLRERSIGLGAPPGKVTTVPYGVDVDKFRSRGGTRAHMLARCALPGDAHIVLAAGRLVAKKGFTYLLRAVPAILEGDPRARIVIAGEGDLRGELRSLAFHLGVRDRVSFPGALSHDEMALFFGGADVVVVPSIRDDAGNVDGLPNVLMEAMASGTPVVASRVAGIPQVVQDGVNGLLVPEKDSQSLAKAILALLRDPAAGERLASEARSRCESAHSWVRTSRVLVEGYRRILDGASGAGHPPPG